jgi:hypothetical protein
MRMNTLVGTRWLLSTLILLIFTAVLAAGDFYEGIGYHPVDYGFIGEGSRDTSLYHHTNSVDQLWYGTNRWVVRFNLDDLTTDIDSMTVMEVNVYFPSDSTGDTFNLRIYDEYTLPLDSLAVSYDNITYQQGWNSFELPVDDQFSSNSVWIEINYETNSQDKFMAASAHGGQNSFFWVPPYDAIPGYFANMAENNISAEFVVTLQALLHFQGFDLELVDFKVLGNIFTGGSIYPQLTVKNNSPDSVNVLGGVAVQLSNAGALSPDEFWNITLPVDIALVSGAEETYTFDQPQYSYRLSGYPSQYRLRAELQVDNDLFTPNNIVEFNFNTFTNQSPFGLVENFIRTDHVPSNSLLSAQHTEPHNSLLYLNFFVHPEDQPYYRTGSAVRRDFYGLSGYPFTVVNGIKRIAGYHSDYADSLNQYIADTTPVKTPFTMDPSSFVKTIDPDEMLLNMRFAVENASSYIYTNILNNLRMYFALFEHDDTTYPGNNLLYSEIYQSTGPLQLGFEDEHLFIWGISMQGIQTNVYPLNEENYEHFSIVFWLQDINNKTIYYADRARLDEFDFGEVGIEDDIIVQPLHLSIYPNPFDGKGELNIRIESDIDDINRKVSIYNIKGQLIKQLPETKGKDIITWDGSTSKGTRAATGVYLMHIETESTTGRTDSKQQRFLIIR